MLLEEKEEDFYWPKKAIFVSRSNPYGVMPTLRQVLISALMFSFFSLTVFSVSNDAVMMMMVVA